LFEEGGMVKILAVDDEGDFLFMITMLLKANGYEVITACDGREGLTKAKNERPDLIILDVMMPEIDGFEVCKLLKSDEQYSGILIIICTAMAQTADLETSNKVGADAYISKPFDHKILLSKIEKLLK